MHVMSVLIGGSFCVSFCSLPCSPPTAAVWKSRDRARSDCGLSVKTSFVGQVGLMQHLELPELYSPGLRKVKLCFFQVRAGGAMSESAVSQSKVVVSQVVVT